MDCVTITHHAINFSEQIVFDFLFILTHTLLITTQVEQRAAILIHFHHVSFEWEMFIMHFKIAAPIQFFGIKVSKVDMSTKK